LQKLFQFLVAEAFEREPCGQDLTVLNSPLRDVAEEIEPNTRVIRCLLYTSDAADE